MPAPDEVARFQAALAGPPAQTQPGALPGEAAAPTRVGPVDPAAPRGTPGDAILRGLERMGDKFNATVDNITRTLEQVRPGETLPAADLLRLQLAMTEVTMQQDVTGKVVGKATQNLDTFLKNQ
jgi:type III secretion system YscI/HrpB-like protein